MTEPIHHVSISRQSQQKDSPNGRSINDDKAGKDNKYTKCPHHAHGVPSQIQTAGKDSFDHGIDHAGHVVLKPVYIFHSFWNVFRKKIIRIVQKSRYGSRNGMSGLPPVAQASYTLHSLRNDHDRDYGDRSNDTGRHTHGKTDDGGSLVQTCRQPAIDRQGESGRHSRNKNRCGIMGKQNARRCSENEF